MGYHQPEEWRIPTRQEMQREAAIDRLIDSYEERFTEFCDRTGVDPEDVGSVVAYEIEYEEEADR